jgi:hypothetical protein
MPRSARSSLADPMRRQNDRPTVIALVGATGSRAPGATRLAASAADQRQFSAPRRLWHCAQSCRRGARVMPALVSPGGDPSTSSPATPHEVARVDAPRSCIRAVEDRRSTARRAADRRAPGCARSRRRGRPRRRPSGDGSSGSHTGARDIPPSRHREEQLALHILRHGGPARDDAPELVRTEVTSHSHDISPPAGSHLCVHVHESLEEPLQRCVGRPDACVLLGDPPRLADVGRVLHTNNNAAVGPVTLDPGGQMPHRGTALVG